MFLIMVGLLAAFLLFVLSLSFLTGRALVRVALARQVPTR